MLIFDMKWVSLSPRLFIVTYVHVTKHFFVKINSIILLYIYQVYIFFLVIGALKYL